MTDKRDPIYDDMKKIGKEKFASDRKKFLSEAKVLDDGNWTKHTEFHWSRIVNGLKLDYWPSRKKWQYKGKVKRGNVLSYIRRISK